MLQYCHIIWSSQQSPPYRSVRSKLLTQFNRENENILRRAPSMTRRDSQREKIFFLFFLSNQFPFNVTVNTYLWWLFRQYSGSLCSTGEEKKICIQCWLLRGSRLKWNARLFIILLITFSIKRFGVCRRIFPPLSRIKQELGGPPMIAMQGESLPIETGSESLPSGQLDEKKSYH